MSRSVSASDPHHQRGSTPNVAAADSQSVSTVSSSSSQDDDSSPSVSPRGDISLGASRPDASNVAGQGITATAPAASINTGYYPACTPNVRYLVRSAALLTGCASLTSIIYGGIKISMPADPGVDPQRAEHMGLMVAGAVWLAIAFVAGHSTMRVAEPRRQEPNPA